jgi:hypothetical protein
MARGGIGWLLCTFWVYAGKCLEFKRVDLKGYLGQMKGKKIEQGRDFGDVGILGQFSLFGFMAAFVNFEVTDQRPDVPRIPGTFRGEWN